MKVLIFTTQFYQLGGAEQLAVELAKALNNGGIRADILSMYAEDLPGVPEATKSFLKCGIPSIHFLCLRMRPPIMSLFLAIMKLRRLIVEEQYDIVETSLLGPTILASWATLGTKARLVVGLHQVYSPDRENSIQHNILKYSVQRNHGARYYAISDIAAEHWSKYAKIPAEHIRKIYNGISMRFFSANPDRLGVRMEQGLHADARIVIYVGRLAAYKGIDTLLNALAPILVKEDLFLFFVGLPDLHVNGTAKILQQMKLRIAKNLWGERVQFLGFRNDVPRIMASADVLVDPTRMEGFGLCLVEAMAAGLPVVASNAEAIPEILLGTESMIVSPDDPNALRKAILKTLHRSPVESAKAVDAGRNRAEEFRMEKRVESMVRLFEDVLEGRF
ncbi:MAG: glycosyltransferase family 4 protein [Desulfobacterium sp.]|nr:glycosyltransferase family 4 protein [Desulfobacterium sp.]MBU3948469.1 glycosyltransferase family 4 protein [Pseudomonadota bacterium]MBU4035291.1 glycosyltransferase family 4 protein [Pseudomonadota bacterium]